MLYDAVIEVNGETFCINNATKIEKLIYSLKAGDIFAIRWLGYLEIMYISFHPYVTFFGEVKEVVTIYCDKVVYDRRVLDGRRVSRQQRIY